MVNKAIQVPGNYFYFFPTLAWAQRALWDNICPWAGGRKLLDVLCPDEIVERKNNSDFFIDLINGSRIKIAGTDNLNFVGQGGAGYVLSEFSLHKDDVTGFLAPILREGNAWVIFNGTLRGKNNPLWILYEDNANRKGWFTQWLTLEHTKTDYWISPDDGLFVNPELVGKISPYTNRPFSNIQEDVDSGLISFSMARQEYLNEAVSQVSGSYFIREIEIMEGEGRHTVKFDGQGDVYTFWDLGGDKMDSDTTCIVWATIDKYTGKIEVIDYYENTGHLRGHYFQILKSKPYRYGGHYIPHDGKRSNTWTGEGMAETARSKYDVEMRYIPKADSVQNEIEILRREIKNMSFDMVKCKKLFEHLTKYHESETTGKPCHRNNCSVCKGASHGVDTLRLLAMAKNGNLVEPYLDRERRKISITQLTDDWVIV
jgi:hypothetical protein